MCGPKFCSMNYSSEVNEYNRPLHGIESKDHSNWLRAYDRSMAKAKKVELESPVPIFDEEGEETLAAVDEGICDAKSGRTIPAEEVRKWLPKWVIASWQKLRGRSLRSTVHV